MIAVCEPLSFVVFVTKQRFSMVSFFAVGFMIQGKHIFIRKENRGNKCMSVKVKVVQMEESDRKIGHHP